MARPERFERPTPRFVVWCSIQLSYGRVLRGAAGRVSHPASAARIHKTWVEVTNAPLSYRLPGRMASTRNQLLPPAVAFQTRCQSSGAGALAADVHQLDRPVGNDDSEGRADGAFNQMYFAVMGAHQFGGDRKAEPAAAGAA